MSTAEQFLKLFFSNIIVYISVGQIWPPQPLLESGVIVLNESVNLGILCTVFDASGDDASAESKLNWLSPSGGHGVSIRVSLKGPENVTNNAGPF